MAKLILTLEGVEEALFAGLDSFVRSTGWAEGNDDTQIEHARKNLMAYIRKQITEYNLMKIGNPEELITESLNLVTSTLEEV
jgi:hypothetical protein